MIGATVVGLGGQISARITPQTGGIDPDVGRERRPAGPSGEPRPQCNRAFVQAVWEASFREDDAFVRADVPIGLHGGVPR